MIKTLDEKLKRISEQSGSNDFVLADAKDADMAFGRRAPGMASNTESDQPKYRTIDDFRRSIRELVEQQLIDIVLMSASTGYVLNELDPLFARSPITPAIRANDTTDIWLAGQGLDYATHPSLPFRTASIDEVMHWQRPIDLGLYSITLNGRAEYDRDSLRAYQEFRDEASAIGFRHFLEVFAPNAPAAEISDVPAFVNDSIVRLLAGIPAPSRPLFLKVPYFGPGPMESLVSYDSSLVIGIMGGAAGTTKDAFHMLWEAKKYGARIALFGRKINQAEDQLAFVRHLRAIADGNAKPAEAVKAYHSDLERLGITPRRSLADDLQISVSRA